MQLPVIVSDRSWHRLKAARAASIPTYYGEILAEAAEHQIERTHFGQMIAATDSHAYNTLVCTDLAPSFGREHVFQVGRHESDERDPHDIAISLGGRTLMKAGYDLDCLLARLAQGWQFRKTKLTPEFDFDALQRTLPPDAQFILSVDAAGRVHFATIHAGLHPGPGDNVLTFGPQKESAATESGMT